MLAVHWTPVSNTKNVLKNGITQSKMGLYCFPLTGHKSLDRWWIYFFNQCKIRERVKYNGVVFRITKEDLPAYFGHRVGTRDRGFKKNFTTLKQLQQEFRDTVMFRLGERLGWDANISYAAENYDELVADLAEQAVHKSPRAVAGAFNDRDLMEYAFEDYQIVLSQSIPAKRIVKVLPQGDVFGRVIKARKQHRMKYGISHD